jgi:deoxyadenosine/deoxycytidine kinase
MSAQNQQPYIVSIEGNIGAGKTTLVEELKTRLCSSNDIVFLCEPVDVWESVTDTTGQNILMKFYENPQKYAVPLQMMALTTRMKSLQDAICDAKKRGAKVILCERTIDADYNIFAKMLHADNTMEDIEFQIYKKIFDDLVEKQQYKLDGIIYIDADTDVCLGRIEKRNRKGESLTLDYLDKCKEFHDNWILSSKKQPYTNLLHIKTNMNTHYDSTDPEDIGNIWINQIQQFLSRFIE